jgi:hypothetical protein
LNQPVWKLVIASAAVSVIGFFAGAAISATTQRWRARWLVAVSIGLAALCIFTYWQLRRPQSPIHVASFTVAGTEVQQLHASGAPGGPEEILPPAPALTGGTTYLFDCYSVVRDGHQQTVWLRLAGYEYWYPLGYLHPTPGVHVNNLPGC